MSWSEHLFAGLGYQALFDRLPTAYLAMDRELVIVEANRAYCQLLDRSREELVGRYVFDAFPPTSESLEAEGRNALRTSFERVRDAAVTDEMPLYRYDVLDPSTGAMVERYWSLVHAPLLDEHGQTRLVLQRVEDVTDYVREREATRPETSGVADLEGDWRRRVEQLELLLSARARQLRAAYRAEREAAAALRASEARVSAILESAVDAIITVDGAGVVQSMNPAAERMFGYAAKEVVGGNVSMLMPEPYRSEHDLYMERYQCIGEPGIVGWDREVLGRRSDGSTFPVELAVSQVGDTRELFTGVVRDITERKRLEEQLVHQALHDPLTGLANRGLLLDRLEHALARQQRRSESLALLFIDLDRFKSVNDTLGHDAGDEALVEAAGRLRSVVRPEDLVARLGGDEFVILCEELVGDGGAESIAKRVVEAFAEPLWVRGRRSRVSASVGVVIGSGQHTAVELLDEADAAMYQAKQQGRGTYQVLDDIARELSRDRRELTADLSGALTRGEMRAVYQPLVDLGSGEVMAVEALVRWQHAQRGLLLPGAFLTLCDEAGVTRHLDRWMLGSACTTAASWSHRLGRPVGMWVNLSNDSLRDWEIVDMVDSILERTGLPPFALTLEISEGSLMHDTGTAAEVLMALAEIGVQLAVDDFGTGYSSLAYLQQFPVHTLKIDRSFVQHLDQGHQEREASTEIVRAVLGMAAGLGLRAIAEGVETPGQLAAVRDLGCDLAQGFFLGRPAPADLVLTAIHNGVMLPVGYEIMD